MSETARIVENAKKPQAELVRPAPATLEPQAADIAPVPAEQRHQLALVSPLPLGRGALIQAQLQVGPANDRYEQEADRVAEQVMRMPEPETVQRAPEEEADEDEKPLAGQIQRLAADGGGGFAAPPEIEARINASAGGGSPLPQSVREFMEPRFGADFGSVRLRTGPEAASLNSALSARAFTRGKDIYLGAGEAAEPGLLAHELTHTIQQGGAQSRTGRPAIQRFSLDDDPIDWSEAMSISASAGGAGGVFFLHDNAGATLVVKFVKEGSARAMTSDRILNSLGVPTAGMRAYFVGDPEGQAVLARVTTLKDSLVAAQPAPAAQGQGAPANAAAPAQAAIAQAQVARVVAVFNLTVPSATTVQISRHVAGAGADLTKLPDARNQGHDPAALISAALSDQNNVQSLGRMFVADAFLGNQDRLEAMNLRNIMLEVRNGQVPRFVAIDNDIDAPNIQGQLHAKLVDTARNANWAGGGNFLAQANTDIQEWTSKLVEGGIGLEGRVSADMRRVTDAYAASKDLADGLKLALVQGFANDQAIVAALNAVAWDLVRRYIGEGMRDALIEIRNMFTAKGKPMKRLVQEAQATTGGDDQAHWEALKVREKYLELRSKTGTHAGAIAGLEEYALKRYKRTKHPSGLKAIKAYLDKDLGAIAGQYSFTPAEMWEIKGVVDA
jgi:hypothetical protein